MEPANYQTRIDKSYDDHLSWEEFVDAIKDPICGLDAYVYNMTKNFQHEPQQTVISMIPTTGVTRMPRTHAGHHLVTPRPRTVTGDGAYCTRHRADLC